MFISDPSQNTSPDVSAHPHNPPRHQPLRLSNALLRVFTGMVLIPLVLFGAFLGGWLWSLIVGVMCLLCLLEFYGLALTWVLYRRREDVWTRYRTILFGVGAILLGGVYILIPMILLVVLRAQPNGLLWIVTVFGITAGTDTIAYVGGGLFGRRPLVASLSPNKTVEGALCGILGGAVIVLLFVSARSQLNFTTLCIAFGGPFVAILGDLLESALKRAYHIKDSHLGRLTLVPGHGGVLDRGDSLLLVTPFVFVVLSLGGLVVF